MNYASHSQTDLSGVPHGSVLGPNLFHWQSKREFLQNLLEVLNKASSFISQMTECLLNGLVLNTQKTDRIFQLEPCFKNGEMVFVSNSQTDFSGFVHGSVLGPILFQLLVNDIFFNLIENFFRMCMNHRKKRHYPSQKRKNGASWKV